jgi:D-glycero-alpha-D-manno-heptose-7-phosphate kinase
VADLGGWTDTWFARAGRVCSVAVEPGACVTIDLHDTPGPVRLLVGLTGESYDVEPGNGPGRHPLLEAAIALAPPPGAATVDVGAVVPHGSGMGTSAAVVVALLGALAAARGDVIDPPALARTAHQVETQLGQSGVQDQWAAALGGIAELEVCYPDAVHRPIPVTSAVMEMLDECLVTVSLGRPHASSMLHEAVIRHLEGTDPEPWMHPLRQVAAAGASALSRGDIPAYGRALQAGHEAIRALDPSLVCEAADDVVRLALRHGGIGWKVNGAGGDGGSITVLIENVSSARAFRDAVAASTQPWMVVPHRVARQGLRITAP